MSASDAWSRFEQAVLADPALQADLDACTTDEAFTARALGLAADLSVPLGADEVEAALRRGGRRWIEHGL